VTEETELVGPQPAIHRLWGTFLNIYRRLWGTFKNFAIVFSFVANLVLLSEAAVGPAIQQLRAVFRPLTGFV
jgi:hypothetical protein